MRATLEMECLLNVCASLLENQAPDTSQLLGIRGMYLWCTTITMAHPLWQEDLLAVVLLQDTEVAMAHPCHCGKRIWLQWGLLQDTEVAMGIVVQCIL